MGEFSSSKTTSSSEEQLRLASKMWARACMFCSLRLTRDFQSEPLCMKSAEWFWQGWVWSAACAVCLLFFLRYRKSMRLTCVNCCRSTGGSEAIVYPQGALETFPHRFSRTHAELIQLTQILAEVLKSRKWLLLTEYVLYISFCNTLAAQLAGYVTGEVKIISLCGGICSTVMI